VPDALSILTAQIPKLPTTRSCWTIWGLSLMIRPQFQLNLATGGISANKHRHLCADRRETI